MARRDPDDDVPRLPRGRGLRFSTNEIVRIMVVATALVALIVLQKPCANSMSKFVTSFGEVDAGLIDAAPVAPAIPEGVRLRTDMTPAELQAAIEAARAADTVRVDAGAPLSPDAR